MITLEHDSLVFAFPEIHPAAVLRIECERTLRIPDDDQEYPLPPGLGRFPLRHVDDYAATVPPAWREHGGVLLPMYQAEALWLNFEADSGDSEHPYPFAVQVATGKVSAITGEPWRAITGEQPPTKPWTAQEYTNAGLPWFVDYYAADQKALEGAATLKGLTSVAGLSAQQGKSLPDNAPVAPQHVIPLGPNKGTRPVREGVF
jgi:hypothetical protein